MAQALLNQLNIKQDNTFVVNENTTKAVKTDFAKIFDKQTAKEITDNKSKLNTTKENLSTAKSDVKTSDKQNLSQGNNTHTLGDLKIDLNSSEAFRTEFDNAVQESAANMVVDLSLIEEDVLTAEEESIAEDVEKIIENEVELSTEEINSNIEEAIETIITEEDPTMYNELNTLENPTVAIMLHSQVQTTVKNVVSETNTETATATEKNNVNLTTTNDKDLSSTNLFKQFDSANTNSKDVTINLSKDDYVVKSEPSKMQKVIDEKMAKELNIQVVEAETEDGASSNNLMQQQTPQEQVAKVMIQGDVKFDKLQFDAVKMTEIKPTEISSNKIIEQITKQLDGMYNNTKLNIVLNPEHLGKVNLHLVNSKGSLMAQFTVTTQEARDILMKGLNGLKESLLSQGISVDNVSIKLEESKDGDKQSDWTEQEGSRGGNKQQGSKKQQKEQEKPFEQMMFELNNNGKV